MSNCKDDQIAILRQKERLCTAVEELSSNMKIDFDCLGVDFRSNMICNAKIDLSGDNIINDDYNLIVLCLGLFRSKPTRSNIDFKLDII